MENIEQTLSEVTRQMNTEAEKYRALEYEAETCRRLADRAGCLRDRMRLEKNTASAGIRSAAEGFTGKICAAGFMPGISELEKAYSYAADDLEKIHEVLALRAAEKHAAAAAALESLSMLTVLYARLTEKSGPGGGS